MNKIEKKLYTIRVEPDVLAKWHEFAGKKNKPLSEIIKLLMSNQKLPKKVKQRQEAKRNYSIVDPKLLFEINAIGNNINQISRRVNEYQKFDVLIELQSIEQQLERLLNAHKIH
jgi:mRNA-degrading endonuclease RelE of RelBE toxin-antitoxin system